MERNIGDGFKCSQRGFFLTGIRICDESECSSRRSITLLSVSPQYKVVGPRGNGEAVSSPTDTTPTQENPPFWTPPSSSSSSSSLPPSSRPETVLLSPHIAESAPTFWPSTSPTRHRSLCPRHAEVKDSWGAMMWVPQPPQFCLAVEEKENVLLMSKPESFSDLALLHHVLPS